MQRLEAKFCSEIGEEGDFQSVTCPQTSDHMAYGSACFHCLYPMPRNPFSRVAPLKSSKLYGLYLVL